MKNIKTIYIVTVFALVALVSCSDVLDTSPADAFAEDQIYSDPDQAERLVYTAYNSTESWGINKQNWWARRFNLEAGSFEAKFNFKDIDQYRLRGTGWNPNNMGALAQKWSTFFYYVRLTNEFLDNIDKYDAASINPEKVKNLKGEMKFLRANLYSKLIKYYGGVPIMEHALSLNDDYNLVRDSYEDCVAFIVKELDEAVDMLPETRGSDGFGRATQLSALAVKSRTLLHAASKLHDPAFAPSNDPLYTYSVGTKWQDAADAAKELIDMVNNRDLISVTDAEAYQKLFLSPNEDILFARAYGPVYYDFGTDVNSLWDQTQSPSGYGGWALSSPTHNFALEFRMDDGTSTDESSFDPANPNANRELRYYADLNFQGTEFRGRPIDYALSEDAATYPDGLDSPNGLGNVAHSSKTGYNMRKFQDESLAALTDISAKRPFILYRLAEVYLNYAEAQYHLGNEDIARTYLNKVASRAHVPTLNASGEELLEEIKTERRIELAFEGHNFFDERRWMNVPNLGMDVKGLTWTKSGSDGSVSNEEYTVVTRPWYDKQYYLPVPASEVEKAPSMVQNWGY